VVVKALVEVDMVSHNMATALAEKFMVVYIV